VGTPLWLDHASVQVPELGPAVEHLDRLGLRATVSPAAPDRHSRAYLHRSYLEVSARPGGTGWSATSFFLRFEDPMALRAHLDAVGLAYRFGEYEGVDGTWDDVEIDAASVPFPILVRRTAPPEVARDWPPALAEPHRCGARTLAEVHVGVPSLGEALEAYGRLLGLGPDEMPGSVADPRSGRMRLVLPLASGRVVLLDGGTGGVERIVLGVASLEGVDGGSRTRYEGDPVAWLDPGEAFGLELGLAQE